MKDVVRTEMLLRVGCLIACLALGACAERVTIHDVTAIFRLCEAQTGECEPEESHVPQAYLKVSLKADKDLTANAKRLEIAQPYGIAKPCTNEADSRVTTDLLGEGGGNYSAVFKIYSPRYSDIRGVIARRDRWSDNLEDFDVCFAVGGGSIWARLDSNIVSLGR